MSEQTPQHGRNGGIVHALREVGHDVIRSLPAQFLALIFINLIFIVALFWHENNIVQLRTQGMVKLLDSCLERLDRQSRQVRPPDATEPSQ